MQTESGTSEALNQLLSWVSRPNMHARSEETDRLAKRGLPLGTQRLVDFAKAHQIKIHDLKRCYTEGKITLTVYRREGEIERNKQEWWITMSQGAEVLNYWQQQSCPYVACMQCPHPQELEQAS